MRGLFRFASAPMTVLVRLVMILSLVGYSTASVNAAMHPPQPVPQELLSHDAAHTHATDTLADDANDPSGSHEHAGGKTGKECCKTYCGVTAIACHTSELILPAGLAAHTFGDDVRLLGSAPGLHQPPKI